MSIIIIIVLDNLMEIIVILLISVNFMEDIREICKSYFQGI